MPTRAPVARPLPAAAPADADKGDEVGTTCYAADMADDLFRVEPEPDEPAAVLYQHTVLAQTCLPYRDPGPEVRLWRRSQGAAHLEIEAGRAFCPERGEFVDLGLPFGPKPRLILAHLNAEALRTRSPEIEIEASLTAFAKRLLGYDPNGREIRLLKDHLGRLSVALIRLAVTTAPRSFQIDTKVVSGFDLWFPQDEQQRVLWPSVVKLSADYFQSLQRHAVPLDERAVAALSRTALGLDLYAWLAQRLHRIDAAHPALVPWKTLKDQFGWHYSTIRKFRQVFRSTLDQVQAQYPGARIELDQRGIMLRRSQPPVLCRRSQVIHGLNGLE
jgi:hypothetical protein